MVRAVRGERRCTAILVARLDFDSDTRAPSQRFDAPDERLRAETPPHPDEARSEINDLDGAGWPFDHRAHERGVDDIALAERRRIQELDLETAVAWILRAPAEKRVKDRISIEARKAAPHDASTPVDERADAAVADEGKFKRGLLRSSGISHWTPRS